MVNEKLPIFFKNIFQNSKNLRDCYYGYKYIFKNLEMKFPKFL
jgi:hypothetical protein